MHNGNSIKKHVYVLFLSDFVMFTKTVLKMTAFRTLYLVKLVNLTFMHELFWSVYNDIVPSNVTVNRLELLA